MYTSKSLENYNQATVPNVVGMTAAAATQTLINRGFNVRIVGASYYNPENGIDSKTAVVISQSVDKGTIMTKGSVVTLYFDESSDDGQSNSGAVG